MSPPAELTIKPAGDQAMMVEFEPRIDRAINRRVRRLAAAIGNLGHRGVMGMVPSYRSLLVYYDPIITSFSEVADLIRRCGDAGEGATSRAKRWHIPVCYEGSRAIDIATLASKINLTVREIIELHCAVEYMVYVVGFSPGFSYLGELPPRLEVPRKAVPAAHVPANAIQIGGQQTAVSSMPMPSGWYVVGQTPVPIYAPQRDVPFLLEGGDLVAFTAIDEAEFQRISELIERGQFRVEWEWAR